MRKFCACCLKNKLGFSSLVPVAQFVYISFLEFAEKFYKFQLYKICSNKLRFSAPVPETVEEPLQGVLGHHIGGPGGHSHSTYGTHTNTRDSVTRQCNSMLNFLQKMALKVKGSVSRQVRHRLLYIIRKLFLKPLSADHFYLFLLKGYAAIYI